MSNIEKPHYEVMVHIPHSEKIKVLIVQDTRETVTLPELMNKACFDTKYSAEMDANFISKYNRQSDEYDYIIQRMCGFAVDDEENPFQRDVWVPYINEEKQDWTDICQNNRLVGKQDNVVFKFEKYERIS